MPLGDFEREVLRLLAANRHPDSFVGGAQCCISRRIRCVPPRTLTIFTTPLKASRRRYSVMRARCASPATRSNWATPGHFPARRAGLQTKVEWVFDSAFAFFRSNVTWSLGGGSISGTPPPTRYWRLPGAPRCATCWTWFICTSGTSRWERSPGRRRQGPRHDARSDPFCGGDATPLTA